MKKSLTILLLAACAFVYADEKNFMVMSDMHVMVKSLWDQNHPEVFYSDPKMVEHSQELFDIAIERVKEKAPDFLLVPGDLTYNGEKANHEYVAKKFAELKKAGIAVFVIPGNHDISDPGAKDYSTGKGVKTANLSATEFAELYSAFGYGDAVLRLDEGVDSLAYMTYLGDNIAIIGLNTNKSNIGGHKSAGGFTEGMMTFLKQCTDKALKDGRDNILVMAHHPIMEHINGQSFIDVNHIANMEEGMIPLATIQEQLTAAHVHVVFTGHAHLHTASHISTANGDLYDISTGSTSSYPSPMRIGSIDTNLGLITLTGEEIEKYMDEGLLRDTVLSNGAINTIASKLYANLGRIKEEVDKHPSVKTKIPALAEIDKYSAADIQKISRKHLGEHLYKALCALSRGDEDAYFFDNEAQEGIDAFNAMLEEIIGVDYTTVMTALEMADIDTDFGVDPEMLFNSIYDNNVFIGDEEYYTSDGAGGENGAPIDDVSLRDPKSSYTLTVKGDEHGTVTGTDTYDAGSKATIEAKAKEHYHFVEWKEDGDKNAKREITVNADATYTAVFAIDQHTVSVVAGEHGNVTGAEEGKKYDYGTTLTLEATADEHYHFVEWKEDKNTNAKREITVNGDATYTAVFAIDQHTITVKAEHGKVTGAGIYDYGKTVKLTATADEHYHFVQWSDGNKTATREITVNADATYTAQFAIDQHTITVKAEHGRVTGAGTYDYGKTVKLTATADEHYHFVQWSDGNKTATREITVKGDATYTAVFAIDQHTIKTAGEHGKVTGAGTYDYGKTVTLTATADNGYEFKQWSDGNTDNPREVKVTEDITYTAVFEKKTETATETVEQNAEQSVKRMENGKLVIYINGKRYNAAGQEL